MCGISGYISDNKLNGPGMVASLHHRGPDNSGEFSKDHLGKHVFLGHNRLSIIDLSKQGNQPMSTADGMITVVFNGEIYNFQELKRKYFKDTFFRSGTDTEVVLYLYEKLGINFVAELNGDFAIAFFDERISKLYLIKDRFGIKPLYYFHDKDTLVFASEIKSIRASGIKPELARENLFEFFAFKYTPGDHTLFKDIKRVPAACYLEYDLEKNKVKTQRYWTLKKNQEYAALSHGEAEKVLYNLMSDAVSMRLISDVPVGTFLSGGLDSSIIASFLKNNPGITHYCASKSEADLKKEGTTSDFYYASRLANDWGLKLSKVNIGSDEANLAQIKTTIYHSDDLIADGSQISSYLITKAAGKNSKVILSGMGADELFMGYAGHLLILLSQYMDKLPKSVSNIIMNIFRSVDQGRGSFIAYRRYIYKMGNYYSLPGKYKYGLYSVVGNFDNVRALYKEDVDKTIHFISGYFKNEDVYEGLVRFEMENFLAKNLNYTDRMAMANSVECRVPFLDHRVAEFAFSMPREYKLTNTFKSKKIVRDAFREKLPEYILKRRKAGFGMPLRSIFSTRGKIDQLLDRTFFSNFNGFSVSAIEGIIEKHLSGREDNSAMIYALISFQEWHRINF